MPPLRTGPLYYSFAPSPPAQLKAAAMAISTAHYTSQIIADLTDRTIYEAWVLEAVYNLTDVPIAVSDNDNLIYQANGGQPTAHLYATAHIVIGDWKPKFLEVGTPLVFV